MLGSYCNQISGKLGITYLRDFAMEHVVVEIKYFHLLHLHQAWRDGTYQSIVIKVQHPQFTVVFFVDVIWNFTIKVIA